MKALPSQPSLRAQAVKLLARREHSRNELRKKLAALGTIEEIDGVLDQLEQTGLLSDARAAAAYVRGHAARFGAARLRYGLRNKGIDAELIETSLAEDESGDEMQRARALWRQKYGNQLGTVLDAHEAARRARFMQSRGFSTEIIRKLLAAPEDE